MASAPSPDEDEELEDEELEDDELLEELDPDELESLDDDPLDDELLEDDEEDEELLDEPLWPNGFRDAMVVTPPGFRSNSSARRVYIPVRTAKTHRSPTDAT